MSQLRLCKKGEQGHSENRSLCKGDSLNTKETSHNLQQHYSIYIYNRHLYYVYVLTNPERTVLYTAVT
jgi:hypothetical protein